MNEYAILMIIFGILVLLAGLYLVFGKKGDFTQVLLWKSNVKKMRKSEVSYAGKVTILVSLSLIISALVAYVFDSSIIALLVLIITFILFLIIGIKIFK